MKKGKTLNGVIVYEILPDGCLNGVFSNDHYRTGNQIFNEVARNRSPNNEADFKIEGEYNCCYMDDEKAYVRDLKIANDNGRYKLIWTDQESNTVFEGIGWKTRNNQLTVSYWD
jgi:hypothetical protein